MRSSENSFDSSDDEGSAIGEMMLTTNWDFEQALQYNPEDPEIIRACVHDLFAAQAKQQPNAPAIFAWDHEFTYSRLDDAATRLAHHLIQDAGVGIGDLVHVCFEKSAWFFVAMLAINKAGAAWVPLDPGHPSQRHQQIVEQTGASLALTSPSQTAKCTGLVTKVIEVTPALDRTLEERSSLSGALPQVSPDEAVYVLFTSGSTGTPKGLVMQHGAVCTSQRAISKRLRTTPEVRILQFAAYVFDLCIGEIVGPLISGACLCVPSEEMRLSGLRQFIHDANVNWAFMTPSFARTMTPADVPSLELLLLAGEAVPRDVFDTWFGKVRFINGWGPAETCVFSTLHEWKSADESPLTVGTPVGGYCWIVDPEDPSRLSPTGLLGEVVIQGPTLLREYLADPVKTAAATVTELPEWAPRRDHPQWGRFFKSGDLCSYNDDGTILFTSRKDTQVKIRGLRVELGEVEHHMTIAVEGVRQVVVDVFHGPAGSSLVAFLCFNDELRIPTGAEDDSVPLPLTPEVKNKLTEAVGQLNVTLPSYMVPTIFVPCSYMPSITSTKIDRVGLRGLVAALDHETLATYSLVDSDKRPPETPMEHRMQQLWADVLSIPLSSIGRDDNFLRIGGDSITAIGLVNTARDANIAITAKDIFDDPRLSAVASKAIEGVQSHTFETQPFSLAPSIGISAIKASIVASCGLQQEQDIEDIYPSSGLQEGLMALSVTQPGSYIAKYAYRLSPDLDISKFKSAWEKTLEVCTNLRTRIVLADGVTFQALTKDEMEWEPTEGRNLQSVMDAAKSIQMQYGSRLCRYAFVDNGADNRYFVMILHHAIHDGWSLNLIFESLIRIYTANDAPKLPPYSQFIKYTTSVDVPAAEGYWKEQLEGAQRASFPPVERKTNADNRTRFLETSIPFANATDKSITKATLIRAAWAIVLARYCDTDDVCFGATISGRQAPVAGLDRMAGPAVATVPVRIRVDGSQEVSSFLQEIQRQASSMVPYEQFGMAKIAKLGPQIKEACDFSSLMVIQPVQQMATASDAESSSEKPLLLSADDAYVAEESMEGYFTYPLVVEGFIYNDYVKLMLIYKPALVSEQRLEALSQHFNNVVQQLLIHKEKPLGDISIASDWDLQKAIDWNSKTDATPVQDIVPDLISKQASVTPDHEAIVSSERSISYKELDQMTTRLAVHLSQLGVGLESMVPVCSEKSIWTIVAILGIMKAGGVYIPLDPSHPESRREALVREAGAKIIVASPTTATSCQTMVDQVVELSEAFIADLSRKTKPESRPSRRPTPSSMAYIIFTSGSTGKPKSIVVEHAALATSIVGHGRAYSLGRESRVLQFSSYVFDVSLSEILETLVYGGTVCVPSDAQRLQSIAGFIADTKVNTALLTSTFLRTLTPADIPTIKTLILVGEPPAKDILDTWHGHVTLANAYGPSEICVFCTSHVYKSVDEPPTTIGTGFGSHCWIVEQDNYQRLAPIGCTGELLIQREMARGYLNDEERTAESFIHTVDWLPTPPQGHTGKFYRSGDLVRYIENGVIEYLGRRDTQVKVRGYRVELGEVEYNIKQAMPEPDNVQVAVDVVRREAFEALVAFVAFNDQNTKADSASSSELSDWLLPVDEARQEALSNMVHQLRRVLPKYMVPAVFLPMVRLPFGNTLKLDRKRLREFANGISQERLAEFNLDNRDRVEPTTEKEFKLRDIWAQVLRIAPESIGKNDSFLQIGGDSITAIQLVTIAHEYGMGLTVAEIFEDSRLCYLAAIATEVTASAHDVKPFSLLPADQVNAIKDTVQETCALTDDLDVEDIYPCSSLQEGLMALTAKQPGSYIAKYVYGLPDSVNVDHFKAAWAKALELCGNLRTRIITHDGVPFQAVMKTAASWEPTEGKDISSSISATNTIEMVYGSQLCRYALVSEPTTNKKYFILMLHHAIFDGWSLNVILHTLHLYYFGNDGPRLLPYSAFIDYQAKLDKTAAGNYWKAQLDGVQRASFPEPQTSSGALDHSSRILKTTLPVPSSTHRAITKATILRAAWAIVLGKYCDSDDVCFGSTVSGRNAPLPGIDRVTGPILATVPVRVRMDSRQSVTGFLHDIQKQASDMTIYEQFGLQNIAKVSSDAKDACNFANLLIIQPMEHITSDNNTQDALLLGVDDDILDTNDAMEGFFNYPLVTQGFVYDNQVELMFIYKPALVSEARIEALSRHLQHVIRQLLEQGETLLKDVSVTSSWDLEQAQKWNASAEITDVYDSVPNVISKAASRSPSKEALYSSEGSLTYAELDRISTLLGIHLVELGVSAEKMVSICFEKSIWAIVAMLAIMKAGGAFVPLDPSHPTSRRKALVEEVGSEFTIVSPKTSKLEHSTKHVVELSQPFLDKLSKSTGNHSVTGYAVKPSNAAYVIFTSGSTGRPKAIVMEHHAVCTSMLGHGKSYGMTESSRVLQFSNTVFDVSLCEILTTLSVGGAVCVPSDTQRLQGITSFITEARVNAAMLTPSFASTFSPDEVLTLKTLVIGGEAPTEDSLKTWFGRVKVINGYGPAEACIYCATYVFQSADESPTTIGQGSNNTCWIVDPEDYQKLAPIGCIGELLLHGTSLARGYANNPEVTQQSFLKSVSWLPSPLSEDRRQFYKTGDLVKYNADGTIQYVGRRDTQVKLRGQRIELAAIEHSIKAALLGIEHVAVDVIRWESREALAAFIDCSTFEASQESEPSGIPDSFLQMDESLQNSFSTVLDELKATLPGYMIPTFYLPVREMPFLLSMKLDRKKLRQLAHTLSAEQLIPYSLSNQKKVEPTTEMEFTLRGLWAQVLNISPEVIGKNDSFLQIGGDSITAIRLVTLAHEQGIGLTIPQIFENSRLSYMASKVSEGGVQSFEVEPFGLIPKSQLETVQATVRQSCGLSASEIVEDIYPCTSLQAGLMALAVKQPGSYIAKYVYRLPSDINIGRFKAAWATTMNFCGNLRTRIVLQDTTAFQTLIQSEPVWESTEGSNIRSVMSTLGNVEMQYGTRLCRHALVEDGEGGYYFVLVIHHAVFDGWTLTVVLNALHQAYTGGYLPQPQLYSSFINYTLQVDPSVADEYWKAQLQGAQQASFPPLSRNSDSHADTRILKKTIALSQPSNSSITKATILRAAWAIILARYCDTNDICFGTTVSGRNAAVPGLATMAGPAVATVPIRVRINNEQLASQFVLGIQKQSSEMIPFEQYGLQKIAKLGSDYKDACDFSSLLVVQPVQHTQASDTDSAASVPLLSSADDVYAVEEASAGYFSYPLVLQAFTYEEHVDLMLTYDAASLPGSKLEALASHFENIVGELLSNENLPLGSLQIAGDYDLQRSIAYNNDDPELVTACVHELVESQAKLRPDAPAISAWDAELTYSELNDAATRLAVHLVKEAGVSNGDLVHVCFEKSAWFFVAMLAVNKAGGAWVPLDPGHPSQRHQQIVTQTGASVALVSPSQAEKCATLFSKVIEVTEALDTTLRKTPVSSVVLPEVSPDQATYVLFTSGSTGTPKGLVMQHGAVCTSQTAIAKRLRLTSDVRMLQFASYVFDLCIGEIVGPLISGACLCIPSEEARMSGLREFIRDAKVNWAFLTPSFARTITPADVPSLELLLLAGEAVPRDVFDTWFGNVRFINGWGPAETCVFSTLHEWESADESPLTVGRSVGGYCWIVDPEDPSRLAPTGCIGEVVIQGPTILREYLSDPAKTAAATISSLPDWAPRRDHAKWARFFKSGDLCSYNPDGTIEFASRKDTQIKIRGLRVELGEVEHHMRNSVEDVQQVVVDVFHGAAGSSLVAFLCFSDETRTSSGITSSDAESMLLPLTPELKNKLSAAVGKLSVALPSYMVPSIFLPCHYMPSITSTKIDRGGLRRITAVLDRDALATYSLVESDKRAPETPMEHRMQQLWSIVLSLPQESIGRDDNFLRIGGDSITAIRLVTTARESGIEITVQDIFNDPRLSAVAAQAVEGISTHDLDGQPFDMLPHEQVNVISTTIKEVCGLSSEDDIEDAYPCTGLQEGLMALAVKQPGSYIAKYIYRLPDGLDTEQFKQAWARTISLCGNLRTRIVVQDGVTFQALVKTPIAWEPTEGKNVQSVMDAAKSIKMEYGTPLCRYALVDEGNNGNYFVLILHHAVFDGWSLNLILGTLVHVYAGLDMKALQPYSRFIKYTANIDASTASNYWHTQLGGARRTSFPPTDLKSQYGQNESRIIKTIVPFANTGDNSITKATILRAAWAMLLARYSDSDDVCFGTTISGRQAPVPGLDQMAGPAVATIPVRVRMDNQQPVSTFLRKVQQQAVEMIPYEQFGLAKIIKLGADIKDACDFSSLLVIQPVQHLQSSKGDSGSDAPSPLLSSADDAFTAEEALEGYFTYPLVIQGYTHDNHVELVLIYQPALLSEHRIEALSQHFKLLVHHLQVQSDEPLGALDMAGDYDLQRSLDYNPEDPQLVAACVHELVKSQAKLRPNAPAISSWDAELTYSELDESSTRLAYHLIEEGGVSNGDLVHVCFEKSAWFFVAMLAINKAGAAWVPLDPGHPSQRHQQIVNQTEASVALVSPSQSAKCTSLFSKVIEVTAELDQVLLKTQISGTLPEVSPSQAAYVLFTSGSTGTPKGLVMQHGAVCTSQTAISKRLRMTPNVRMLQFASFVFDLCIGEIICPLITGACLCVPSEEARLSGLREFIHNTKVNWAFMTPSFARTILPTDVPSLELLLLAGEAIPRDVFDTWFGKVRFINGWGPAETCVFSTLHEWQSADESPLTVGRPVGGYCWIVDPEDPQRLAPTGCVGEVVIQGPTLLREYLSDPVRTSAAMITSLPEWAPRRNNPIWGRFFKSGDLCSYNSDGTIEFASRKDTQIKIRGLRVELGEVEHHMRSSVEGVHQVVVDVFHGAAGSNLVAFLCFSDETCTSSGVSSLDVESILLPITADLKSKLTAAAGHLSITLPSYMVPSIFIPCKYMPTITSTKVDRSGLRRIVGTLDHDTLAAYSLVDTDKRAPETPMEHRLQKLWATVLNISPDAIGRDDSFLRIGGDSITAIRLVTIAREADIGLTVKDIFDDPRLSAVASKAFEGVQSQSFEIEHFSLLPAGHVDAIKVAVQETCKLDDSQSIEDVYPCTSLQEGLMALTVKQPGSYIAKYVYSLPADLDVGRFKAAWEKTLRLCSNLRTRIILQDGVSFQAIIDEEARWELTEGRDLRSVLDATKNTHMQYGTPLCRYSIVNHGDQKKYFILTIHHSIFDGWSLNLILGTLYNLYFSNEPPTLLPYSLFINFQAKLDKEAAAQYWKTQLDGAQQGSFPESQQPNSDSTSQVTKRTIRMSSSIHPSITKATILRAAWAVVLARYSDTDDICFGTTVSGRNAPLPGIETLTGPTLATVPVRIQLNSDETVSNFLQDIQNQASEMIIYEQFGLQNISKVSPDAKAACNFSSLLIVQPMQHTAATGDSQDSVLLGVDSEIMGIEDMVEGYFTYPLVTQALVYDDQVELMFIYKPALISDARINALCRHLEHVIEQLLRQAESSLQEISVASSWDLDQAQKWNAAADIIEVYDCVHNVISKAVSRNPGKEALYSSEGSLTYAELDEISTQLGTSLTHLGVGPEKMVAICFEKSIWAIVAMLGIMKAGGAFVPLDPSHPTSRRKALVEEVGAEFTIVSPQTSKLDQVTNSVVELSSSTAMKLSSNAPNGVVVSKAQPSNAAYVIFTSGSTGRPKAIVMEHHAVCTSILGHGKSYGMTENSRVLQFSNTVFDVSLCEILTTLSVGGTVCVPSDSQRLQSIANFITEARVNAAMLTPSFASTFSPEEVPTLKTLVIGGEAPTKDSLKTWFGKVRVINGYGPAEACIYCATYVFQSADESPTTIGQGSNNTCWIVDPNNYQKLAPIGCIGELLLHGTSLARGYANNPEVTQQSFLKSVNWLPPPSCDDKRQFYKTGDLVKYNANGTIQYVGRRDTQVKLRGQRIELAAVEHSIKKALPSIEHVAVDVIKRESRKALAAFIDCSTFDISQQSDSPDIPDSFLSMNETLQNAFGTVLDELKAALPGYMIPTFYLPVREMPFLLSMKLDRKKLRQLAHTLSAEQLIPYSLSNQKKVEPTTEMEFKLRELWSQVLNINPEIIGKNDSFLQIGGDSITAIQLVTLAQEHNIGLTIGSIFEDSRLSHMATLVTAVGSTETYDVEPFGLLPTSEKDAITTAVRDMCHLSEDQEIEDIYPTTAMQDVMMSSTSKDPFVLSRRYIYRLSDDIDAGRFKAAWEATMDLCANLRTRIIKHHGKTFQAIIQGNKTWESTENHTLASIIEDFYSTGIYFASPLVRYALVEDQGHHYFALFMHHTVFDGWSLTIMLQVLQLAYSKAELPTVTPLSRLLNYVSQIDQEASAVYWKRQFNDFKPPRLPFASQMPRIEASSKSSHLLQFKAVPFPRSTGTSITKSTLLRAAWAVLIGRYSNADDVCAVTTIIGRNIPIPDISMMSGTVFACVPVRMRLDPNQSVRNFLQGIQTQASGMIPHEQFGLEQIAGLSPEAKAGCEFPWEIIIQPLQSSPTAVATDTPAQSIVQEFINPDDKRGGPIEGIELYPISFYVVILDDEIHINLFYNPDEVPATVAETLVEDYSSIAQQLLVQDETALGSITVAAPQIPN